MKSLITRCSNHQNRKLPPSRPKESDKVKISDRFSVLDDAEAENADPEDTTDGHKEQEPPSQGADAHPSPSHPSGEGISDPVSTRQHEATSLSADDLRPVRHNKNWPRGIHHNKSQISF